MPKRRVPREFYVKPHEIMICAADRKKITQCSNYIKKQDSWMCVHRSKLYRAVSGEVVYTICERLENEAQGLQGE